MSYIDKEIALREQAFGQNPMALKQRGDQSGSLLDILAFQKVKSENDKVAAARAELQKAAMEGVPTGTVKDQLLQDFMSPSQSSTAKNVQMAGMPRPMGGPPMGGMPRPMGGPRPPMGGPPMGGPRPPMGGLPMARPAGPKPGGIPGALPPMAMNKAPGGIAGAARPRPPMPMMASGGIVGYEEGGDVDSFDPLEFIHRALDKSGTAFKKAGALLGVPELDAAKLPSIDEILDSDLLPDSPRARAVFDEALKDAMESEGAESAGKMFRGLAGAGLGGIIDLIDDAPSAVGDFVSTTFTGESPDQSLGEKVDDYVMSIGQDKTGPEGKTTVVKQEPSKPSKSSEPEETGLMAAIAPEDMPEDIGGLGFEKAPMKLDDPDALEAAMGKGEKEDMDLSALWQFMQGMGRSNNRNLGRQMLSGMDEVRSREAEQIAALQKQTEMDLARVGLQIEADKAVMQNVVELKKLDASIAQAGVDAIQKQSELLTEARSTISMILASDETYIDATPEQKVMMQNLYMQQAFPSIYKATIANSIPDDLEVEELPE